MQWWDNALLYSEYKYSDWDLYVIETNIEWECKPYYDAYTFWGWCMKNDECAAVIHTVICESDDALGWWWLELIYSTIHTQSKRSLWWW